MKIMLVSPHLNLGYGGGSEKQIIALAGGFARSGCEVTVFLTDGEGDLIADLPEGVETVLGRASGFFSRLWAIYQTAKAEKPDILYGRLWRIKPALVLAGKTLGIKTVVVEDNNPEEKAKAVRPFTRAINIAAKSLCYKSADAVISISEEGKKQILKVFGVETRMIHNGIDTGGIEELSEEEANHRWFSDDIPIAIAVGRLVAQKGYENLVESVGLVNKTTPLRLLVIGGGNKSHIVDEAEKLGIGKMVDFTGAVRNPHKYTTRCDIFVCSSLFEGFGLVLAEAMALAMPVVSTDYRHGAAEIVEDGASGILVPVGDCGKMADAILKLIKDRPLAGKMGEEAKKRAENFGIEKMTEKTLQIFKDVLGKQA
ncbi:glycosyltransferase [Candidatus Mycalebacterium sp.]